MPTFKGHFTKFLYMKSAGRLPHPSHGLWLYVEFQKSHPAGVGAIEPVHPDICPLGVVSVEVIGPAFFGPNIFESVCEVAPPEDDAAFGDQDLSPFFGHDGETLVFPCPDGPEISVPVYVPDPDAFLVDLMANPG